MDEAGPLRWVVGQVYLSGYDKDAAGNPCAKGPLDITGLNRPNKNHGLTLSVRKIGGWAKAWAIALQVSGW